MRESGPIDSQAHRRFKRVDAIEHKWQRLLAAAENGNDEPLRELGAFQAESQAFRREMLLAINARPAVHRGTPLIDLAKEWESQFQTLEYDIRSRSHFDRVAAETHRRESLILSTDRDPGVLPPSRVR